MITANASCQLKEYRRLLEAESHPNPTMPDTHRLQPAPEGCCTDDTNRPPGDGPDTNPTMPGAKRWKWDDTSESYQSKLEEIRGYCNDDELKLMGGVAETSKPRLITRHT